MLSFYPTDAMVEEKTPTVSVVGPMAAKLKDVFASSPDDSKLIKACKEEMSKDWLKRYQATETRQLLDLASFLDPRFKNLTHCTTAEKEAAHDKAALKAAELRDKSEIDVPPQIQQDDVPPLPSQKEENVAETKPNPDNNDSKKRRVNAMDAFFGDIYITQVEQGSAEPKSSFAKAKEEVTKYKEQPPIAMGSDPLLWWKESEPQFPILGKLAKHILCIPSTSVPSERVFSTAGDIVTAARSRIKWRHVDKMIFLKKNLV